MVFPDIPPETPHALLAITPKPDPIPKKETRKRTPKKTPEKEKEKKKTEQYMLQRPGIIALAAAYGPAACQPQ